MVISKLYFADTNPTYRECDKVKIKLYKINSVLFNRSHKVIIPISVCQDIDHYVNSHPKRLLALFRWVIVNLRIFQTVSYVALVVVEDDHAAFVEKAISARRLAVMLVDFR